MVVVIYCYLLDYITGICNYDLLVKEKMVYRKKVNETSLLMIKKIILVEIISFITVEVYFSSEKVVKIEEPRIEISNYLHRNL